MLEPKSVIEVQEAVNTASTTMLIRGGGTKTALSTSSGNETVIDLSNLSGILEYRPEEFTFTALSGTSLKNITEMLSENGQWLPFDPPMAKIGATIGGTLATGLSGPGRYRFGGARDFVLGVGWVSGAGEILSGGAQVVKNVAGFDFPKLMIGSLGRFGIISEITLKVFPKMNSFGTVEWDCGDIDGAVGFVKEMTRTPIDLFALDLESNGIVRARLGGLSTTLNNRLARLSDYREGAKIILGDVELNLWEHLREFLWLPDDYSLIKVPITPDLIPQLDACFTDGQSHRKYSVGGNVAWIGWSGTTQEIDTILSGLGLGGLLIIGSPETSWIGTSSTITIFAEKVKRAFDPEGRFLPL